MVSFTPRPLYDQGKNPLYPLDRRLGGPQSWPGRGDEKKSLPLPRIGLGRSVRSPSTTLTELPRSMSLHELLTTLYTVLVETH